MKAHISPSVRTAHNWDFVFIQHCPGRTKLLEEWRAWSPHCALSSKIREHKTIPSQMASSCKSAALKHSHKETRWHLIALMLLCGLEAVAQ